ncbi:hypothetical protein MML48_2g00016065 [Holotrichia oblita]|uniref:Uncharacterized protein n=1 Tax=Holotrichia oblita TaxID=644536 RepID=A0ACB9TMP9_HOLOL|nr:hypothetical protein MML48_2g00016065 [Holotrichia oblita]
MAKINSIKVPLSWETNKLAEIDCWRGFRERNADLSRRRSEPCRLARATSFNKETSSIFDNLEKIIQKYPSFANGTRIYNLHETGTSTAQKPQGSLHQKDAEICGEKGIYYALYNKCCESSFVPHYHLSKKKGDDFLPNTVTNRQDPTCSAFDQSSFVTDILLSVDNDPTPTLQFLNTNPAVLATDFAGSSDSETNLITPDQFSAPLKAGPRNNKQKQADQAEALLQQTTLRRMK